MGRLIDTDEFEKRIKPYDTEDNMDKALYNFAHYHLVTTPSVQPEVIRCRDCKYWREHKYAKETKRYIPFCGFNAIYTKADDFCSYAERRTDSDGRD